MLNDNPAYAPKFRVSAPTTLKGRIFHFLRGRKERGATVDEISVHLGLLNHQVSPRTSEMCRKGFIHITDVKRITRTGGKGTVYRYGAKP